MRHWAGRLTMPLHFGEGCVRRGLYTANHSEPFPLSAKYSGTPFSKPTAKQQEPFYYYENSLLRSQRPGQVMEPPDPAAP